MKYSLPVIFLRNFLNPFWCTFLAVSSKAETRFPRGRIGDVKFQDGRRGEDEVGTYLEITQNQHPISSHFSCIS